MGGLRRRRACSAERGPPLAVAHHPDARSRTAAAAVTNSDRRTRRRRRHARSLRIAKASGRSAIAIAPRPWQASRVRCRRRSHPGVGARARPRHGPLQTMATLLPAGPSGTRERLTEETGADLDVAALPPEGLAAGPAHDALAEATRGRGGARALDQLRGLLRL